MTDDEFISMVSDAIRAMNDELTDGDIERLIALARIGAAMQPMEAALKPFAEAWDVATRHVDLVKHLSLAQLGELVRPPGVVPVSVERAGVVAADELLLAAEVLRERQRFGDRPHGEIPEDPHDIFGLDHAVPVVDQGFVHRGDVGERPLAGARRIGTQQARARSAVGPGAVFARVLEAEFVRRVGREVRHEAAVDRIRVVLLEAVRAAGPAVHIECAVHLLRRDQTHGLPGLRAERRTAPTEVTE